MENLNIVISHINSLDSVFVLLFVLNRRVSNLLNNKTKSTLQKEEKLICAMEKTILITTKLVLKFYMQ